MHMSHGFSNMTLGTFSEWKIGIAVFFQLCACCALVKLLYTALASCVILCYIEFHVNVFVVLIIRYSDMNLNLGVGMEETIPAYLM